MNSGLIRPESWLLASASWIERKWLLIQPGNCMSANTEAPESSSSISQVGVVRFGIFSALSVM